MNDSSLDSLNIQTQYWLLSSLRFRKNLIFLHNREKSIFSSCLSQQQHTLEVRENFKFSSFVYSPRQRVGKLTTENVGIGESARTDDFRRRDGIWGGKIAARHWTRWWKLITRVQRKCAVEALIRARSSDDMEVEVYEMFPPSSRGSWAI